MKNGFYLEKVSTKRPFIESITLVCASLLDIPFLVLCNFEHPKWYWY